MRPSITPTAMADRAVGIGARGDHSPMAGSRAYTVLTKVSCAANAVGLISPPMTYSVPPAAGGARGGGGGGVAADGVDPPVQLRDRDLRVGLQQRRALRPPLG